jgi:hypothetical protein
MCSCKLAKPDENGRDSTFDSFNSLFARGFEKIKKTA